MARFVDTLTNDFRALAVGHCPNQVYVELISEAEEDFVSFCLTLHLPECCAYLGQFLETAVDAVIPAEFLDDDHIDLTFWGSDCCGDATLHPEFSIESHLLSNDRVSGDDLPEWFVDALERGSFSVEGPCHGTLH